MYNESIKKRYIQEKENSTSTPKEYLTRLFNKSKSFEESLNKDICCFTTYEIIDFYKTISISTLESLIVFNNHLSLYVQWCLQQNLVPDCQNHFDEINNDTLIKCINITSLKKAIITRNTLYTWLSKLENPGDAFVMLALFEGIKGKEFCELAKLKLSDFSGNKVKLCTGREITVSDKLVELAELANKTLKYYGETRDYPLEDEGYIIKKRRQGTDDVSDYQRGRRIYNKLLDLFRKLGVAEYMKPNSLTESGKIDYINMRAKELGMTGKDFLYSDYVHEVEDKYEYDMKRLKLSFCRKYGEYLI